MGTDKRERDGTMYRSDEQSASPAARRREEEGYRRPEDFDTEAFVYGDFNLEAFDDFDDDGEFGPEGFERGKNKVFDLDNFEITLEGVEPSARVESKRTTSARPTSARTSKPIDRMETQMMPEDVEEKNEPYASSRENTVKRIKKPKAKPKKSKKHRGSLVGGLFSSNKKKDVIGFFFVYIQLVATIIFIGSLLLLNVLPFIYLAPIIVIVLFLLWWIRNGQYKHKYCRWFGKLCSMGITTGLIICAYCFLMLYWALVEMGSGNSNDCTANLSRDTYNLYISGNDVYGDLDSDTTSRSDVNIITTVNPLTGQILMTTTPRDYYVVIPGVSGDQKDKLTHAGNYGVDASMDTLAELYDTEVEIYMRVNFTSIIDIINILGGVTVQSDISFTTSADAGSGIVFDVVEGANRFTGEEALAYARERYNLDGGDNQRGVNQQALLEGIFWEVLSPSTLLELPELIECVQTEVDTNLTTSQLQQFIKGIIRGGLGTDFYSVAATGTGDYAYCYSYSGGALYVTVPSQSSVDSIKDYMSDVEDGEDLPSE